MLDDEWNKAVGRIPPMVVTWLTWDERWEKHLAMQGVSPRQDYLPWAAKSISFWKVDSSQDGKIITEQVFWNVLITTAAAAYKQLMLSEDI